MGESLHTTVAVAGEPPSSFRILWSDFLAISLDNVSGELQKLHTLPTVKHGGAVFLSSRSWMSQRTDFSPTENLWLDLKLAFHTSSLLLILSGMSSLNETYPQKKPQNKTQTHPQGRAEKRNLFTQV